MPIDFKFLAAAPWMKKYGNPDDPAEFSYPIKYSPCHQVQKGVSYSATLLITGDSDTRVAPLHARKTTTRFQAATSSDQTSLLRYGRLTGH